MSARERFMREAEILRGLGEMPTTDDLRWLGEQEAWEAVARSKQFDKLHQAEEALVAAIDNLNMAIEMRHEIARGNARVRLCIKRVRRQRKRVDRLWFERDREE